MTKVEIAKLKVFIEQLDQYIRAHQDRGANKDQRNEEYWNGASWTSTQIKNHFKKELNHGRE